MKNVRKINKIINILLTMDAIAALNFGIVISIALRGMGVTKEKEIVTNTIKAGAIA